MKKVLLPAIMTPLLILIPVAPALGDASFDFILSIDSDSIVVSVGENITVPIRVNLSQGEPANVSLSGEWIGDIGANYSISPSHGKPNFTARVVFSEFQKVGKFVYRLRASGRGVARSVCISITVSDLKIEMKTDKTSYTKGESICLIGNVTSTMSEPSAVDLLISCGEWERYTTLEVINGSFSFIYNISYGDPEGKWNISVSSTDSQGNKVCKTTKITVATPVNKVGYKIVFLSPAKGAIYTRGTTFNISVFVSSGDKGIAGLSVSCVLPSMEKIVLKDIGGGYYTAKYTVPWYGKIGRWYISVEALDNESGFVGGENACISVRRATIKVSLLEPSSTRVKSGDIDILIKLTYPSGEVVEDAEIKATVSDSEINFIYVDNGTYKANFKEKGSKQVKLSIYTTDAWNNSGSFFRILYIMPPSPIFSIDIFGIAILAVVAVTSFSTISYGARRWLLKKQLMEIEDELNEVRRLQRETVMKYYKEGSISRKTYEILMQEYARSYSMLTDKYGELLVKLRKTKKSKKIQAKRM